MLFNFVETFLILHKKHLRCQERNASPCWKLSQDFHIRYCVVELPTHFDSVIEFVGSREKSEVYAE